MSAEKGYPVIVVGAGPAGLAAAFRLRQHGLRVKLIEAADRVGGKLRSKQREGFLVDEGAFFLPTTHRRMVALAIEAGFSDQISPGGCIMAVAREGTIHTIDVDHAFRDLFRTRLFTSRTKVSLIGLASEFWRSRSADFERLPETARFDIESASTWARRELGEELAEYVVGVLIRGMSGATPERTSRAEFLAVLNLLGGARMVACRGGMGAYASHLSNGMEVELQARVLEVEERADSVRVTWKDQAGREHVETVAGCVIAGSTETALQVWPGLDDWRREYLAREKDSRMLIVNVGLSRAPAGMPATYVLVPRATHPFLCGICSNHHKAPGRVPDGKGLLTVMPLREWGEQHYNDDDGSIIREVLKALDVVMPGVSNYVEFAEVSRWNQRYNSVGHYRDLGRFREIAKSKDARVQLAGDYHGYPQLETAVRSGECAAAALSVSICGQPGAGGRNQRS